MNIKVLGSGCANCKKLEANTLEAVKAVGIDATVEKVEDLQEIMSYGVMSTPALVIDGQVKVMGRVPSSKDIQKYLKQQKIQNLFTKNQHSPLDSANFICYIISRTRKRFAVDNLHIKRPTAQN